MGTVEYLDKERFVKNQGFLKEAAQCFSDCNIRMFGSADHYYLQEMMNHYDSSGEVSAGVARFKEAQRRLTDLREAMDAYLKDWEQAQEDAKNRADQIDGGSDTYNGPSFAEIYEVELEEGPDYDLSPAYNMLQSGKSFSVDYNDLGAFIWNSEYGKSTRNKWGATQFSNKENYWEFIGNGLGIGDGNYELMNNALTASLESMLKQLPGYEGADVDYELVDWDALGEKVGIQGLGNLMKMFIKTLKTIDEANGEIDPDAYEGFVDAFEEMKYQFYKMPWLATFFENLISGMAGVNYVAENSKGFVKGLGTAIDVQEYLEFGTKMIFHMISNHSLQVGYLESFRESLEVSGFTNGVVIEKIEELERMYSDNMEYFTTKLCDNMYDWSFGEAMKLVTEIPGLKEVAVGMDLISGAAKVAWGEETGAMNTLMGLYQYDEVLTRTFENYTALMEQGIATAEDVERANDLYDILLITKKQEYENILKIVDDKKSEWYILATEKLEELNNLPTEFDLTSKNVFDQVNMEDLVNAK